MCNNCGEVGYTIEINDEGVEYIESCFECFVEAHEQDQKVLVLSKGSTLIDIRPEPARGVAYTLGGLS